MARKYISLEKAINNRRGFTDDQFSKLDFIHSNILNIVKSSENMKIEYHWQIIVNDSVKSELTTGQINHAYNKIFDNNAEPNEKLLDFLDGIIKIVKKEPKTHNRSFSNIMYIVQFHITEDAYAMMKLDETLGTSIFNAGRRLRQRNRRRR